MTGHRDTATGQTGNSGMSGMSGLSGGFTYANAPGILKIHTAADGTMERTATAVDVWGETGGLLVQCDAIVGKEPLYQADDGDGSPAVRFVGSGDEMVSASSITLSGAFTFYSRFYAAANEGVFFRHGAAADDTWIQVRTSDIRHSIKRADSRSLKTSGSGAVDSTWHTLAWFSDGTNAGNLIRLDGVQQSVGTNPNTDDVGTGNASGVLDLGRYGSATLVFGGRFRINLLYDGAAHSTSDLENVEALIADDWP